MVRTSDVSTLNKTTLSTQPHLFLQPRAIVSDESQAKRNNCTHRSSSKQSTTPPNVLNFSSQSNLLYCNNNKSGTKLPPSRKSGDKGTIASLNKTTSEEQPTSVYHQKSNAKNETTSDVSVHDLTKNSRNSDILILEEKHQRLAMSKSFVYPQAARNSRANNNMMITSSSQNEKSEAAENPEKSAEVVATEGSDNFSSNLKHQQDQ